MSGTLTANRLTVAGSVFLGEGSKFNDIDLRGTRIGSTLYVSDGSVVSGTLAADRLTVGGSVVLSDGSQFNDIDVSGADIGALIRLDGAKWASGGSLDLGRAHAGGV